MANYGFIYADLTVDHAHEVLARAAADLFDDRVRVRVDGSRLFVEAVGTAPKSQAEAKRLWLAGGEDVARGVGAHDGGAATDRLAGVSLEDRGRAIRGPLHVAHGRGPRGARGARGIT